MMSEIIVALLAMLGTIIGSGLSIFANQKLTNYKIEELRKTVEKHNSLIERTYKLEEKTAVFEEKISVIEEKLKEVSHG